MMTPEEKKVLVASVFQERPVFESKVLDIQNEKDRVEVFEMIAGRLIEELLPGALNFSHLQSYDDLKLEGVIPAMMGLIDEEAEFYLQEKLKFSQTVAKETVIQNQRFIRLLCQAYYTHYGYILFEKIADTFFRNIAALSNPKHASKVLKECIAGTEKAPLTAFQNSRSSLYSLEQIWQRTHKAYIAKKERVAKIQLELSALLSSIENLTEESAAEKKALLERYAEKEVLLNQLREKPLDHFNGTVKQIKNAIVLRLTDMSEASHS